MRGGPFHSPAFDTWEEAEKAQQDLATSAAEPSAAVGPTAAEIRNWTIERYAEEAWWPSGLCDCSDLTPSDYRRGLKDLLPLIRGVTFNQLLNSPLLVDQLWDAAKRQKTYPKGHQRKGFKPAAADKIVKTLRMICTHAGIPYNPLADAEMFDKRRTASAIVRCGRQSPQPRHGIVAAQLAASTRRAVDTPGHACVWPCPTRQPGAGANSGRQQRQRCREDDHQCEYVRVNDRSRKESHVG